MWRMNKYMIVLKFYTPESNSHADLVKSITCFIKYRMLTTTNTFFTEVFDVMIKKANYDYVQRFLKMYKITDCCFKNITYVSVGRFYKWAWVVG